MNDIVLPIVLAVIGSTGFMSFVQLFILPQWKRMQELAKGTLDEEQSSLIRRQAEGEVIENDTKKFDFYTKQIQYLVAQVTSLQTQVDALKAKEASHATLRDSWAEEKRAMGIRISLLDSKVTSLAKRLSKYEQLTEQDTNGNGGGSNGNAYTEGRNDDS